MSDPIKSMKKAMAGVAVCCFIVGGVVGFFIGYFSGFSNALLP